MSSQQPQSGPPYAPKTASIGGLPSVIPDVPICAVLIAIYIGFAATNMTIFQRNRRRKHLFLPTVFIFGFCMARIATLVLRIAWSTRQHNVRLAIAANIFVNAGILILYVVNLVFAHRILKAEQPWLGRHPALQGTLVAFYSGIAGALAMVITSVVLSAYTRDMSILKACRDVQLAAITYLLAFDTLPLILLALALLLPTSPEREDFGRGSMSHKKLIVATVGCLTVLLAGFKTGTAWMPPRPISNPAWYHSKACFYVFNFAIEITMLCILTLSRPDKRFWVPNGSKRPGDYARLPSRGGDPNSMSELEK